MRHTTTITKNGHYCHTKTTLDSVYTFIYVLYLI